MHVFVTGATGWVGSAVVRDLLGAGHRVTGLCRSADKVAILTEAGAAPLRGTLDDHDTLRRAAIDADAVLHLAFNHDFSRFAENARQDRLAIEAIGDALAGTDKPLVVTSGLAMLTPGRTVTELDAVPADLGMPRRSEAAANALVERGVRTAIVRLAPSVHGMGDHGFVPMLIARARETGVSAFVGDGTNRWPGVHRGDAARLYRLVLERGVPQRVFHAVESEGVPFRDIAAAIGRGLGLPVEPRPVEHFGWFGVFTAIDMSAASTRTREALGWEPTGPDLLSDLAEPAYYRA